MKKYSPILLFLFILLKGCNLTDLENDLFDINTFGKVKSIRERSFIANEENGKITVGRQVDPINGAHSYCKEFNKDGFIIELINYDKEDLVKSSTLYKYDSDNRILKEKHYNSDGNLNNIVSYTYNNEHLKSKYHIRNSDTTSRIEYHYDDEGILVEENYYSQETLVYTTKCIITKNDTSRTVEKTTRFTDDEDQIIYEKKVFKNNRVVIREFEITTDSDRERITTFYKYDILGNMIEKKQIDKRWLSDTVNELTYNYVYDNYDKYNNWVSMYKYINSELGNFIEREIEYY